MSVKVLNKIEELRSMEEVQQLGIKIYPGQEIRITDQILPEIEKGNILSLNHSKYLLIELPSNGVPHYTERLFYELLSEGYVPIIAHPERNKGIVQDLDKLYQLVKAGALSQLTSSSLSGVMVKITEDFYTNDRESFNTFYCFRCTS